MYGALAKFYDRFMLDVPYDKWINFITRELGQRLNCGADLCCGTGKITLGLTSRGYDVYGVDISPEMLTSATQNADLAGKRVLWLQGDINKFKFLQKVQFVTAMCDAFNYVAKPYDVFKNIYENLQSGGKLIFDVSTEYKLKTILADRTYSHTEDDITYVWQNCLEGNKLYMDLTFFQPQANGLYSKTCEQSFQYVHSFSAITDALGAVGFSYKAYSGVNRAVPKADSQRIFFVATK